VVLGVNSQLNVADIRAFIEDVRQLEQNATPFMKWLRLSGRTGIA
jgi:hypothetical protein